MDYTKNIYGKKTPSSKKMRKMYKEVQKDKTISEAERREELNDLVADAIAFGYKEDDITQSKKQLREQRREQQRPVLQEQLPYAIVDRQDIRTEPRMNTFIRPQPPVQPQVPQNVHQHPSEGLRQSSRSVGMSDIDDPWLKGGRM